MEENLPNTVSVVDELRDEEARKIRILHAAARMELFRRANGRDAGTAQELREWLERNPSEQPLDPVALLTQEQITAALRDCLR